MSLLIPEQESCEEENECFLYRVAPPFAGRRVDQFLTEIFPLKQSRTYFQFLIEQGAVLVNGLAVKKRRLLTGGDEVSVRLIPSPELTLEAEDIPLDIVYEDEELLAINKPAGMVVHPAAGNWSGTFVNALLHHCKKGALTLEGVGSDAKRPGIIHRLDKDTTGVLLAAKTAQAHRQLCEQFAARCVYKEYLAVCVGLPPPSGIIELPLARHPVHRQSMAVREGGKEAVTHYEVISKNGELSLVKIILKTGRTHQIRVHMSHLGFPILGDTLYGKASANKKWGIQRQLLHAHILEFSHPVSGEKTVIAAKKLPEEMEKIISDIQPKFTRP